MIELKTAKEQQARTLETIQDNKAQKQKDILKWLHSEEGQEIIGIVNDHIETAIDNGKYTTVLTIPSTPDHYKKLAYLKSYLANLGYTAESLNPIRQCGLLKISWLE